MSSCDKGRRRGLTGGAGSVRRTEGVESGHLQDIEGVGSPELPQSRHRLCKGRMVGAAEREEREEAAEERERD